MSKGFSSIFILIAVIILGALGGAYYLGKSSSTKSTTQKNEIKSLSSNNKVSTPTATIATTTPQISPTSSPPTEAPTNTPTREITYKETEGWKIFTSITGYSILYPAANFNQNSAEKLNNNRCEIYFSNNAGGVLSFIVAPYRGNSRREFFFAQYPNLKTSYTYQYEEVKVQGKKGLVIEVGPIGDSGSGTALVLPDNKNALILFWPNNGKDSLAFNNLIAGLKLSSTLDLSECGK